MMTSDELQAYKNLAKLVTDENETVGVKKKDLNELLQRSEVFAFIIGIMLGGFFAFILGIAVGRHPF